MGIKLKTADIRCDTSARPQAKPRYKNGHLPFENPTRDFLTWSDAVLPPIIDWAGTLDGPFAVNSHSHLQDVVEDNWKEEFLEIPADNAVQAVVRYMICLESQIITHVYIPLTRRVPRSATGEVPSGSTLSRTSLKFSLPNHSRTRRVNIRSTSRMN